MRFPVTLSIFVSALLGFTAAQAGTLYGTFLSPGARLVAFDTETSSWSDIGLIGVPESGSGLAYKPGTDTLYMVDGFSHPDGKLYTLDQSTGAATLVGPFNIGTATNSDLRAAAFDTRNGVLYAASGFAVPGDLYWIDLSTGTAHHIAEISGASESFGGLAYDSKRDQLIQLQPDGDLALIDRSTAVATLLYDLPGIPPSTEGFTYDPVQDLLWSTDNTGTLYSYDPNNGYARSEHPQLCCGGISGLTYRTPAPIRTPALSARALVLLSGLLLLSSAAWLARHRARTTT